MCKNKKRVLFLCTGNSCRSQMAEGFLTANGGEKFEGFSAGTNPVQVNPLAIKVMKEAGVDISGHSAKSINEFSGQKFDFVVTVCNNAKDTCPVFPGEYNSLHWDLEDPADAEGAEPEKILKFREIRDKIKSKVIDLIKEYS